MQASRKKLGITLAVLTCLVLLAVGLHFWRRTRAAEVIPVHSRFKNPSGDITDLAFLPFGKELLVASVNGSILAIDRETWQPTAKMRGRGELWMLAVPPDGQTLLTAGTFKRSHFPSHGQIELWDISNGVDNATYRRTIRSSPSMTPGQIAFAPDASKFAICWENQEEQMRSSEIVVCALPAGYEVATTTEQTDWIRSIAYSPDGKQVVCITYDGDLRRWDGDTGRHVASVRQMKRGQFLATLSRDGSRVAMAHATHIEVKDTENGSTTTTIPLYDCHPTMLQLSPDGKILVQVKWETVGPAFTWLGFLLGLMGLDLRGETTPVFELWDAESGNLLATLADAKDTTELAFSRDARYLAGISSDDEVLVWKLDDILPPSRQEREQ